MTTAPAKRNPIPFGKYLLLDRVNIGGMAEVWRGKSFGAGGFSRITAIKRILPNIAEDEEFITMFIDEAKITVQLTHANIAQVYELGGPPTVPSYFIAMEYIAGKDMRAIFERSRRKGEPSPVPLVCFIISKVCEGLDYAHRKKDGMGREMNIVHRDVSPQNVLISYEGEVKLIDFGIAKAAGKASKTQAGILKGKFGYMSPEQIRGLPLDRRSDIFAVGVCLYEMLTGERLFVGDSDFSVLEKVRKAEVLPPSTYNKRVPEALERIVLKALARDVDERYQYANELADDLQKFLITSDNIFSRKDLQAFMKATFAEDCEREAQRQKDYADVEAPPGMALAGEMSLGIGAVPTQPGQGGGGHADAGARGPPVLPSAGESDDTNPVASLPDETPVASRRATSVPTMPRLTAAPTTAPAPKAKEDQATQLVDGRDYLGETPTTNKIPPLVEPPALRNPSSAARPAASSPQLPRLASSPVVPLAETSTAPGRPPRPSFQSIPVVGAEITDPVARAMEEAQAKIEAIGPATPPAPARSSPSQPVSAARAGSAPSLLASPRARAWVGAGAGLAVLLVALLVWALFPRKGFLVIDVSPKAVEGRVHVNIDGKDFREPDNGPWRQWPFARWVPAGQVPVVLVADGYQTFTTVVQVRPGAEISRLEAKLERKGTFVPVDIAVDPDTAGVWIDGTLVKPMGTPGHYVGELTGKTQHTIEAKLDHYRPAEPIKLGEPDLREPVVRTMKLKPHLYPVSITSDPSGASVFGDGHDYGLTPATILVPGNTTELSVRLKCYESAVLPLRLPATPKDPEHLVAKLQRVPGCK